MQDMTVVGREEAEAGPIDGSNASQIPMPGYPSMLPQRQKE